MTLAIYLVFIPIVGLALVLINVLLMTTNEYSEKSAPFECGFTSFSQSRTAFSVAFILVAILFLPFDLEISSILPYVLNLYTTGIYGLNVVIAFLALLIVGFVFELNYGALYIRRLYLHTSPVLTQWLYS